jgi:FkbM family methyltransferase
VGISDKLKLGDYRRQLACLGVLNWLFFKAQSLRARSAPKGTVFSLRVPRQPHPLYFRAGTTDLKVFYQNIIADEYRCLANVNDARLIIDCGANVGYAASHFLSTHPRAFLIAIEPDDGNFAMLSRNLAPYKSRCKLVHSGVWSKETGLVISEAPGGRRRGEWAVKVREAREGETPTMKAVEIGSLLERSGHGRISILKIDIEGAEEVVFAERPAWIDRVDNLVIELHSDECARVFKRAIAGIGFHESRCDELHVFKLSAQAPAAAWIAE